MSYLLFYLHKARLMWFLKLRQNFFVIKKCHFFTDKYLGMNGVIDKLKIILTNAFLGALFGIGIYLIFSPEGSLSGAKKKGLSFRDMNTYRSQIQNEVNLRQKQVELENYNTSPGIYGSKTNPKLNADIESTIPERNEGVLDTFSGATNVTSSTLESRINRFEHIKQKYEELAEIEKQKYVQAFKKEAQQLGYDVEVDEGLNITNVKSKKKPGQ